MQTTFNRVVAGTFLLTFYFTFLSTLISMGFDTNTSKKSIDIRAFITSATQIREGDIHSIYNLEKEIQVQSRITNKNIENEIVPYFNPPIVALLFVPFTYLPFQYAYIASYTLNYLLITVSLLILLKNFSHNKIIIIFLTFINLYTLSALMHSQISGLILLLMVGIYKKLEKNNYFMAGLLSGILFIKVQTFLIIPGLFLISKDKIKYAKGFIVSLITMLVLNSVIWGSLGFIIDYFKVLVMDKKLETFNMWENNYNIQSFMYLFNQSKNAPYLPITIVSLGVYFMVLFVLWKKRNDLPLWVSYSALVISTLTLNIHTSVSDMILLIIPITFLFINYRDRYKWDKKMLLAMLYIPCWFPLFMWHMEWLMVLFPFLTLVWFISRDCTNCTMGS